MRKKLTFILCLAISGLSFQESNPIDIEPRKLNYGPIATEVLTLGTHGLRVQSELSEKDPAKIKQFALIAGIASTISLITKGIVSYKNKRPIDFTEIKDLLEGYNAFWMYKNANKIAQINSSSTNKASFKEKELLSFLGLISRPAELRTHILNVHHEYGNYQQGTIDLIAGILFGSYERYLQSKYYKG